MSEDQPTTLEKVARNFKAVACIINSTKTIVIAGGILVVAGIGGTLAYKAYNTVTDIAEMPGEMWDTATGGLSTAWDKTSGAVSGWWASDDEELEIIDEPITAEVEAEELETVEPSSVEVTYDSDAEGDGWFKMPSLCFSWGGCDEVDSVDVDAGGASTEIDLAPATPAGD